MVLCSDITSVTPSSPKHSLSNNEDKMAHVESCINHLNKVYSGLKVQEEPAVRCQVSAGCDWVGSYEEILYHCKQCHPQSVWLAGEQKRDYTVNDLTTKDCYNVELVVAYGQLFWLHIKNDLNTQHLYAACQQVVTKNEDTHTKFMIRTELCDESKMNCISCSTETRPHTEDIAKIFASTHCAVRSHQRLHSFIASDQSLTFTVNITKMYYYQ